MQGASHYPSFWHLIRSYSSILRHVLLWQFDGNSSSNEGALWGDSDSIHESNYSFMTANMTGVLPELRVQISRDIDSYLTTDFKEV
jgi:hypothetical protein